MPRSSREKSGETHRRILETAYELFLKKGYHGTSMRAVSQGAGVTVSAIYNHFPNKEDLWKAVIFKWHPAHEIIPLMKIAEGETLSEIVQSAATTLVGQLQHRPDLLNLMFIEIVEFNGKHFASLFQKISPEVSDFDRILSHKRGELRNIPPVILLRAFLGLFFSFYITGTFLAGQPGLDFNQQSLDQFVNLYLYGILADDDPSRIEKVRLEQKTAAAPPSGY